MSGTSARDLPGEVLVHIFSFLPAEDISRAAGVCRWWSQMAGERRAWRGKSFLSMDGRRLSDVLAVARALPALKRVSVHRSEVSNIYMNGELAVFEVRDLRDDAVVSAVSALVTEKLSLDFVLLEERLSNCLVVQLHELKQLEVCGVRSQLPRDTFVAKLRALCDTLSREPLPKLHSVDICTGSYSFEVKEYVDSDILGALSTCSVLNRIAIRMCCSLSWHTVTGFSKLQLLQLKNCIIEDISFLDLCPVLHNLSLDNCSPLATWELSRKLELNCLRLCDLPINTEFLDTLCRASPKLERILIRGCPYVTHTSFLGQCAKLCVVEVDGYGVTFPHVVGLPSGLYHLRLESQSVTSDTLVKILQGLPQLKILDVVNCSVESLQFLRHCPGLSELSVGHAFSIALLGMFGVKQIQHYYYELGGLKSLKKLYLQYDEKDVGPLADALCKMPTLEMLDVQFLKSISNLSFLRYCHQLQCLTLGICLPTNRKRLCFHELSNLKQLRKLTVEYSYLRGEDLVDVLPSMPHLEELSVRLVDMECNLSFLSHCGQLTSLCISCLNVRVSHLTQLRQLQRLRRLTILGLSDKNRQLLAEEVLRLPTLEYLCLDEHSPNFLESWEWREVLSSLSSIGWK